MPEVFIHSTVIPIAFAGKRLVEPYGEHLYVVQNPPAKPLTQMEMDDIYALPYMQNLASVLRCQRAAFRQSQKSNSVWSATGAVLADAVSVH